MASSTKFASIISILSIATGTLVTAVPTLGDASVASPEDHDAAQTFSRDVNNIFKIEKRCQSNGQFCDGVGIKCCAGQCCNYRKGVNTYCGNCD
ncbi:hypothetical protein N7541_009608 [Penicillium brevicompactum]|uniref:Uncharacterized protein n=1 Tax=Penicillium brevicompactum TaxID=5074 RepID=A0A9W9QGS3_PENBR|nr:hypothetical protein N7452_004348 [Penicillium brevicompactum]KAJ5340484.1 hypothetical protein N7541_009608 [Penicillium brevicompactum]